MPRTRLLILLLLCAMGCGGGCGDSPAPDPSPTGNGSTGAKPAPPLKDFPKPAFALILSGEQHGYLEPCGCSETQSGGVARRYDLVRQLRERGWEVAGFDLGGTLKHARKQSVIKFDSIFDALNQMDYRALGLGPEELQLGADQILIHNIPTDERPLAIVSANVTLHDNPDSGTPLRLLTFELGGQKIAVTSIIAPAVAKHVPDVQNPAMMRVDDPAAALRTLREPLAAEAPALAVLLSYGSLDDARSLAKEFPEYALIVSTGGAEDPLTDNPVREGKTLIVQVGHKGKYTGVCAFYPDAEEPLKFELVNLDKDRFDNAKEMIEVMRAYQDRLRDESIIESEAALRHPTGKQFVGAVKCGECHKKAYATWKETKHAHAYESLEKGRPGQEADWITRIHDPECISCHTTGWNAQESLRFDSGFVSAVRTPHLLGQQCENCHGPGSRHVDLEELYKSDRKSVTEAELIAERKVVQLTEILAVKTVCYRCHDTDNSPNFDFEKYWPKVRHVGRD